MFQIVINEMMDM